MVKIRESANYHNNATAPMTESSASWITLSAFILCSLILFVRHKDDSGHSIVMTLLTAALCFIGGFLMTGVVMKISGGIDSPVVNSLLVVVGSLLCVTGKEYADHRKKTQ